MHLQKELHQTVDYFMLIILMYPHQLFHVINYILFIEIICE